MGSTIFIGDELTAAGFRLTGIETVTPPLDAVQQTFKEVRGRAAFVLITAEFASRLPASDLQAALLAEQPVTAIVPDILLRTKPPDLVRRLRGILGIET